MAAGAPGHGCLAVLPERGLSVRAGSLSLSQRPGRDRHTAARPAIPARAGLPAATVPGLRDHSFRARQKPGPRPRATLRSTNAPTLPKRANTAGPEHQRRQPSRLLLPCLAVTVIRAGRLLPGGRLELDHQFSWHPATGLHLDALGLGPLADRGGVQPVRRSAPGAADRPPGRPAGPAGGTYVASQRIPPWHGAPRQGRWRSPACPRGRRRAARASRRR